MKTSYFARSANHPQAVSVAGRAPPWYKGREYKKLAPKLWIFKKYKQDHNKEFYTEHFHHEVLSILDPRQVYEELGEDAVLLCYEAPNEFCHRHLVAKWLEHHLGITITEIYLQELKDKYPFYQEE